MKQAIAGVAPPSLGEVSVMTIWPSNARYPLGRFLGRLYNNPSGFYIFTVGHFWALASIPLALVLFFLRIAPFVGERYVLTNRRIVVLRGIRGAETKSLDLDRFDAIDIVVRPGQEWYDAGDLVFRKGNTETFTLEGVSRPRVMRTTCLDLQMGHAGVKEALERQGQR